MDGASHRTARCRGLIPECAGDRIPPDAMWKPKREWWPDRKLLLHFLPSHHPWRLDGRHESSNRLRFDSRTRADIRPKSESRSAKLEWWPGTESNRRHGDFQSGIKANINSHLRRLPSFHLVPEESKQRSARLNLRLYRSNVSLHSEHMLTHSEQDGIVLQRVGT